MTSMDGAAALAQEPADDEAARQAEAVRRLQHDTEFRIFTEDTYHVVERILRSSCRDRQAVEDTLNEAYLLARVEWPKIRGYDKPIGWVIKTARHKISDAYGRFRREEATAPESLPPVPQSDLADVWEAQETLQRWLQQLPPRHADVFQMSCEGFSNREIAAILGLADISVRSYKAAAKRELRQLAEQDGYTDSDGPTRGGTRGSR